MMKKWISILFLVLLSSFNCKYEVKNIPPDLHKSSAIVILCRDFDNWKNTIIGNPKGYDDYAQNLMFNDYKSAIIELDNIFKKVEMKSSIKVYSDSLNLIDVDYVIDHKLECSGGEKERSWWMCSGGFYFKETCSGKVYDIFKANKKTIKSLKSKMAAHK